jgi:hypothetical protein
MNPNTLAGLSPAEQAYFTSGGAVDPVSGKAVEESDEGAENQPGDTGGSDGSAAGVVEGAGDEGGTAKESTEDADSGDAEEGDDDAEVTELADGTNPDGAARRKVISFGAYDKQRVKANKLSTELEQTRQQLAYLTGLVQQGRGPAGQAPQDGIGGLNDPRRQAVPTQPTAAPDPQKEPQKWLDWVNSTLTAAQQAQAQQQQQTVQQQHAAQLNAAAYEAEQEFVNGDGADTPAHPDYYDALKFLDTARRTELKLAGYDPQTAQQIIDAQNKDIAVRALQRGDNAASKFYALAKTRGFKAPAPANAPARNAAGQFAKTEAEKVAEQAAKQKTNKSISGLAGSSSKDPLSIETLANTSTADLAKMLKKGELHDVLGIG